MLALSYYILKVIICSAILFGYYWLALRNKIYHQYNRFYLLAVIVLSLSLPILKINFWENTFSQRPAAIKVLQAVSNSDIYFDDIITNNTITAQTQTDWISIVYILITTAMLLLLLHSLDFIYRLTKKYPVQKIDTISFVNTDAKSTPFSFLNYIFWNKNIDANSPTGKQIFKHEVAHIQEKHTYDKLFINILMAVFWCNPVFWLMRKELYMIHEFIADKKALEGSDTSAFAAMILQAAYPQHHFTITNNFFYSPIKRRLVMLVKNKNPKVNYWSRLLVLPLAVLLFAAFAFKTKQSLKSNYSGEKIIVVIDAGHGGEDHGTKNRNGIAEKDITLAIAEKIKTLNTNNVIEILLTRSDDRFITPRERADAAKAANADLLISLHVDGGSIPNSKTGMSFFISKDEFPNSSASKTFASALINEFTGNYKLNVSPQPLQRKVGIWILQATNIPSVLIETGFINNDADFNFLNTDAAKETIAKNILNAIEKFAAVGKSNPVANENNSNGFMINVKMAKGEYLKSDDYKERALVIIDDKELGNVGDNYISKNNIKFSSIVVYSAANAVKQFGEKGKYGVIKITQKSAVFIKADSVVYDDKTQSVKLKGNSTELSGDFSDALIYVENKIVSPSELKEINTEKIASINILKGEKLDEITEAKGKKAVIYVSLKPDNLPEIVVKSKTETPLYVVDGEMKGKQFVNTIKPENIQSIDVLKGESAKALYGEKGKDGVIKITTKEMSQYADTVLKQKRPAPLYVIDGHIKNNKFSLEKINPQEIESINTLKGEKATDIYREAGKNGVIEITTKKEKNKMSEVVVEGYATKKAVTKYGEIYVAVINKVILPPYQNDKYEVMVNIKNGSINGTDDYYDVTVKPNGLLSVTILKKGTNQILYNLYFKAARIPDGTKEVPVINLADYLKEEVFL